MASFPNQLCLGVVPRCVLIKRCSENPQQMSRRRPVRNGRPGMVISTAEITLWYWVPPAIFRTYFRKIKCSEIKKRPFWKKPNFFLIWIKSVKNNFQLGGIQFPPALLDDPKALLLPFNWSEKLFFKNTLIQFFIFNKKFIFLFFFFGNITYFVHNIMKYML